MSEIVWLIHLLTLVCFDQRRQIIWSLSICLELILAIGFILKVLRTLLLFGPCFFPLWLQQVIGALLNPLLIQHIKQLFLPFQYTHVLHSPPVTLYGSHWITLCLCKHLHLRLNINRHGSYYIHLYPLCHWSTHTPSLSQLQLFSYTLYASLSFLSRSFHVRCSFSSRRI